MQAGRQVGRKIYTWDISHVGEEIFQTVQKQNRRRFQLWVM